jgi:hypothetical protein
MSKVRNLPEKTELSQDDLLYTVDTTVSVNGGRKVKVSTVRTAVELTDAEVKTKYENNADTNAFTDAEKVKLFGIEDGATADQLAQEVPYSNLVSGLAATNVKDAIDEVNTNTQADFRPSIVSGRILHYSGGTARFDDVFFELVQGDILLNPSVTNGEVYVDLDGFVKQTASGVLAPPLTIVFAKFSTDLNDIISLTDQRVKNAQNLVRGTLADVRDVRAGAASLAGASGRLSDAMHKHSILTGAPSTQIPDQVNAEGISANLARADHIHEIPTAAPTVSLSASTTNDEGVADTFSRADHSHAIEASQAGDLSTINAGDAEILGSSVRLARANHQHPVATAAAITQTPDQANAEGVSTSLARADHVHEIPAAAPITTLSPAISNDEGIGSSFSRNDHTHAISTALVADITTVSPDDTASAGVADTFARGDHRHAIAAAAPSTTLSPATANTEGVSTSFSRADHVHTVATALVADITTIAPDDAAAAGTANTFARGDHRHAIAAAAPSVTHTPAVTNAEGVSTSFARADHTHTIATALVGDITTIAPDDTASAGVANTYARGDHRHAIAAAAPITQTPDQANAEGVSTSFARADHIHNIAAATAVDTSTVSAEGVSTSFARADHTHNTVLVNSVTSATDAPTTTSTTDVQVPNMSVTPVAGTYLVMFAGSTLNSGNGAERNFFNLYSGGVVIPYSEQRIGISGAAASAVNIQAITTVNGSQAIQAFWRVIAGTGTIYQRSLIITRIG